MTLWGYIHQSRTVSWSYDAGVLGLDGMNESDHQGSLPCNARLHRERKRHGARLSAHAMPGGMRGWLPHVDPILLVFTHPSVRLLL
jgi:hypothetical protein